jgi:alpha-glucuronidase
MESRLSVGALLNPHRPGWFADSRSVDPAVAQWWKDKAEEIYKLILTLAVWSSRQTAKDSPVRDTITSSRRR